MRILALDTSTFVASVALVEIEADSRAARVLAEHDARVTTHSEMLLPLIARALEEAGLAPRDVDAIACGSGPGSFTGLRIGLATAKGLCVALNKPLVLASSLATLAMEAGPDAPRVLALMDARRREVYAGVYANRDGLSVALRPEAVLAPDRIGAWIGDDTPRPVVVGDGALAYPDAAASVGEVLAARPTPRASALARLAAARLAAGPPDDLATAAPTYVRPPEVDG